MSTAASPTVARPAPRPALRWVLLVAAILIEVAASLSLKGALEQPLLYVVVGVGYPTSFVLLALVLREGMPLGVAYGIWGASGVALTALASSVLYDEPLTALMTLGVALVMGGVLAIEVGSQRAHAAAAEASDGALGEGAR